MPGASVPKFQSEEATDTAETLLKGWIATYPEAYGEFKELLPLCRDLIGWKALGRALLKDGEVDL